MPDSPKRIALPLAVTVLGGCLLPAQFAINAALAGQLRSVTLTGATSYLGGGVFLLLLLSVAPGPRADWRAAMCGPGWAWLGGAVGSAYIVGSVILTRALGAGLATTLVIASQITVAILLDHTGALGLVQRRLNPRRAAAVVLALAALAVRLWGMP
ncbi:DMT family transporter [Longimicrobium terrae]|uniref:Transporter family-2 protein n=1 Tax=Longimicrobium terrae TaxID=1639882 RepID=A0A841H4N0_9BACT|nr:DMT family transporter [Longimicrobium terrae]MBB4638946.1 transporter family-2 protein [Longimicrobium terrae]MBB6073185.1 transporter family-2 protein [Longimicrobium terrae]NNC32360.1 EamA-like transporter family protein [Longimicrobium terrae]